MEKGTEVPFMGFFVVMIFSREQNWFLKRNGGTLEDFASNSKPFRMKKGWIKWMTPHTSIYLTGFSLSSDMPPSVHFQIHCSQDGVTWHLAAESDKKHIVAGTSLNLKRPTHLVKWFKLQVVEGEFYNDFCIHGIRAVDDD